MQTPLIAAANGLPQVSSLRKISESWRDLLEEEPHRRFLALGLGDARIFLAHALQHGQIGAAGERVLAGSDTAPLIAASPAT
jgi:hypothetical protein